MASTDSFVLHDDVSPSFDNDELDSLPSISSSVLDSEDESDAQEEWERSLEQIQLLLTMVIVPFAGKYFGRKFAYWSKLQPGCPSRRRYCCCSVADDCLQQAGHGTWNGCTTLRCGGQTRAPSRLPERQRLRQHYKRCIKACRSGHQRVVFASLNQRHRHNARRVYIILALRKAGIANRAALKEVRHLA